MNPSSSRTARALISRQQFVAASSTASLATYLGVRADSAPSARKLNIAGIGVDGPGLTILRLFGDPDWARAADGRLHE